MRLRKASRGGRVARAAAAGALLTAIFVTPVAGRPGNPGAAEAAVRVLFIGNSLTYANELPAMVEALAAAGGLKPFAHLAVAYGDFGLEDHWVKGDAHRAIARGGWDYVVLQQGPSATEGRPSLYDYSRRYAPEIRKAFELFGTVVADSAGGPPAIIATDFRDAGNGLFTDPPDCLLHHQATFMTEFFKSRAGARDKGGAEPIGRARNAMAKVASDARTAAPGSLAGKNSFGNTRTAAVA